MSWSIQLIGKPEKVIEALQKQSEGMNGESKIEYDSALPHLIGLINENFGHGYPVKILASGHGYAVDGIPKDRQLTASIEIVYGLLV